MATYLVRGYGEVLNKVGSLLKIAVILKYYDKKREARSKKGSKSIADDPILFNLSCDIDMLSEENREKEFNMADISSLLRPDFEICKWVGNEVIEMSREELIKAFDEEGKTV